jgi:tight adherence protein C
MVLVLIAYLLLLVMLYVLPGRNYADIVEQLDKKLYPARALLPLGLYLIDTLKYSFNTGYDRRIFAALAQLHGNKPARMMLKVHLGNKISLMLLSILFVLFVGLFSTLDAGYIVFGISLPIGIAIYTDRDLFERVKKRKLAIQLEFPDFVNKLTLLINAGMTVSKAWEKIAWDGGRHTPLYLELRAAIQDIRAGTPEHRSYEEFAKRCRVPVITRFVSVILQNIRKGNAELVPILRVYANECWELRKSTAKRLGEEASTKLLLPMMLMFIAILLIVGMPAVLSLRNI